MCSDWIPLVREIAGFAAVCFVIWLIIKIV